MRFGFTHAAGTTCQQHKQCRNVGVYFQFHLSLHDATDCGYKKPGFTQINFIGNYLLADSKLLFNYEFNR